MEHNRRGSGILMPIAALPSAHGIGTTGRCAADFLRFLAASGQHYWQILPANPIGAGDSPYSSCSSWAGEPLLIDLDLLAEHGLLTADELADFDALLPPDAQIRVPYDILRSQRLPVLRKAAKRAWQRFPLHLEQYAEENSGWLDDYTLYQALKTHFDQQPWYEWPDELRRRHPAALLSYRLLLRDEIRFHIFLQYEFDRQWNALLKLAHQLDVALIGDLPFYSAPDSCDVWAEPQWFQLDEQLRPQEVAGCPPDDFSADGQLWGNPLYDWDKLRSDGYGWWLRRLGRQQQRCDVLRIDHFRGLESYWSIPADAASAAEGHWVKGAGEHFVRTVCQWFPELNIIAEDLGFLTPEVHRLRDSCALPGMKVLEFAFNSHDPGDYLPHAYPVNCVCYTGTHDNPPLGEWLEKLRRSAPQDLRFAVDYLGLNEKEGYIRGILRGGLCSPARLFIAQMQDWLELGSGCRTNIPGVAAGNWRWRMTPQQLYSPDADALAARIADTVHRYGR